MATTASNIFERIQQQQNQVWTPKDFLDLGKRDAVDKALSRLVSDGKLRRIGHGLYDIPRFNPLLRRFAPVSLDAAIVAIARRDNVRIMPDGFVTANMLGLTNAVPAKPNYLTDGGTRSLVIDGRTIRLRHAAPKVMYWANNTRTGLIVQAIRWLGPQAIQDEKVLAVLKRRVPDSVKQDLLRNARYLPEWILSVAHDLIARQPDVVATPCEKHSGNS